MDGVEHDIGKWDMMIAHPPCVFLTNAATRHFSLRVTPPEKVVERWEKRADAAIFFMQFVLADIPKIAVENPVGFMNLHYKPPTQIIHPWMFAESENDTDNYKTKRTCLWLKGLPPLKPNDIKPPNNAEILGRRKGSNKVRNWCEDVCSKDRSKERSKTFEGIAKALHLNGEVILEMTKSTDKLFSFNKIFYEIKKKYGLKTAREWLESEYVGAFYLHDAPSASLKAYCFEYYSPVFELERDIQKTNDIKKMFYDGESFYCDFWVIDYWQPLPQKPKDNISREESDEQLYGGYEEDRKTMIGSNE